MMLGFKITCPTNIRFLIKILNILDFCRKGDDIYFSISTVNMCDDRRRDYFGGMSTKEVATSKKEKAIRRFMSYLNGHDCFNLLYQIRI